MSKSEKRRMDQTIGIRCTLWEKQLIEKAAAVAGVSAAAFARGAAPRRAHEIVDKLATQAGESGAA